MQAPHALLRSPRSGRMRPLDAAILVAIVAVVVIVSLPRLSAFAQEENEGDAQLMVRRLAQVFEDDAQTAAPPQDVRALLERLPRVERRKFEDQTVVENGRLLLRHGYYFELLRVPTFAGDTAGVLAVRAWPERRTAGAPSFLAFSGSAVFRHAALDPPAGGADSPPQVGSPHAFDLRARGWQPVSATADGG